MTTATAPAVRPAPDLETGWEPTTPTDDTVLRQGVLAMATAWQAISESGGGHHDGATRLTPV